MSSLSIGNNSDGSESGSDSETTNHSRISSKPKRIRDRLRTWNFHYTIQTDLLGEEEVSTDEKKLLLTEHLRTRLGNNRPQAVSSITVFCDFSLILVPSPGIGPLISVPIVPFVQSQNRTVYTIIPWFPDAKWAPVLGGGRPPRFSAVHEPCREHCGALVQAFFSGKLGLNNRGRLAARENRKVFRKPVHPLPRLAV